MARGIIDLIQENRKRFYRGELRNYFFDDLNPSSNTNGNTVLDKPSEKRKNQVNWWDNLKAKGLKFGEEFFYEPAK
ncbi:MAG: hypothetical protein JW857_02425 [Bacteroidales bacterium]|nr:hypothetical protein [Bacteroidales bacterium]